MKTSSVQCVADEVYTCVCVCVTIYPSCTQPLDGKKEGKVSGKDLPWQRVNLKDVCAAGFREASVSV